MRKVLCTLMTVVMLAMGLTGCSKPESTSETTTPTPATEISNTNEETSDALNFNGEKLTVWVAYDTASLGEHYESLWAGLAEDLGIDLDFVNMSTDDYKTKIKVALTGDELPDLFSVWGGSYLDPFFEADAVLPVQDYLAQNELVAKEAYAVPAADGNLYVIPSKEEAYAVTYVNTKLRDEIGVTANPATWDELLELVKATNDYNTANGTSYAAIGLGVADRWVGELLYTVIVNSLDEGAFDKLKNKTIDFTDPVFLDAANRVKTLVDMGAFPSGMVQTKGSEANELFLAGQFVLYPHQSSVLTKFAAGMDADSLEVTVFPDCQEPVDASYATNLMNGNGSVMPGLCISKKSEHADAAAALAVAFAKAANEINVLEFGNPGYLADDTLVATKDFSKALTQHAEIVNNATHLTPYWYAVLPAVQGENWRDLAAALFSGSITPEDFVEQGTAVFTK